MRKPNTKLDIIVERKKLGMNPKMKTIFKPLVKSSYCDNSLDKRSFKRGTYRTKTSWNWRN